ncbi:MAG: phage tail tape measure protein, partial [Dehalococcoidia bacterium]
MAVIAELEAVITARTEGFDQAVDEANNKLNELGKGAGQTGKNIGKMADGFQAAGKVMAAGGALMLAPMVDAVRGAADLQQAMDMIGVAFNATEDQAVALEDAVLDVASSTIFGVKDVADAATILGKAGASVEDVTGGMLEATADFAAATGTQLPTAADIMSRTAAQWGISGEDMIGVADDLVTAFNETSLGAEDWLGGMANFAPIMRLAGTSLEETGAALGFFKDQGLSAREAGTSLTRAMDAMIAPTDKQAAAMADLGITTEDFFEIAEDGQRQFIGWADTFDLLNDKMAGLDDIQKAAALSALFGKEAFDAMGLGMLSNTDDLRALNEAMEDNEGIARKQSEALTDNLLGSIEELGGAYDELRVKMGDPFLDPLQAGVEGVTDLVNALADADPAVQGVVGKMLGLGGSLLTFGGLAAFGTGKVLDMGESFRKAGLSLPKFAAGLGLVGVALGAGLLAYETNFLGFRDTVDEAMAGAREAIDRFGASFDEAFDGNKAAGLNDMAAGAAALGTALNAALGIDRINDFRKLSNALQTFGDTWQEGVEQGVDPWVNALQSASRAVNELGLVELAADLGTLGRGWSAMQESMEETEGQMPQLNRELSALQAGLQEMTGLPVEQFFDDLGALAARARSDFDLLGDAINRQDWEALGAALIAGQPRFEKFFGEVGPLIHNMGNDLDALGRAMNAQDWEAVGAQLIRGQPNFEKFFGEVGPMIGEFKNQLTEFDLSEATQKASDEVHGWFNGISRQLFGGLDSMAGPGERNVEGGFYKLGQDIAKAFDGLDTTIMDALPDENPFDALGAWLQDGMDEISRFFQPQEMAAGLGGAGLGDTSGISQWFGGIVDGIGAGMDQAVTDLGMLVEEKKTGFKNALGDFFGPIGQFLFPSEDALASDAAGLGDPATIGKQFGESMLKTFTDPAFEEGLRTSIDAMPEETFQATGAALLGAMTNGMKTALTQPAPDADGEGGAAGQTMGQQMIQSLADGLTTSLQGEDAATMFGPAAQQLGNTLNTALGKAMTETFVAPGETGRVGPDMAGGVGAQMVKSLATGLTTSLQDEAAAEHFLPAANALGSALNMAMQTAAAGTQDATAPDASGQATGFGQQMAQGLATGLTNGITAADPSVFVPVSGALGAKLAEAMSQAAQPVQPPGGVGPIAPDSGIGTTMVQGLAQGLTDSITAAPVETFTPVGTALGTKLGEALQSAVGAADGQGESDIGNQLGVAVGEAITGGVQEANWDTVGSALGTKLGETLQTVAAGEGELDISQQVGDSVGQMLQTGIEQADFSGVGEQLTTQLSDQLTSAIDELSGQIEEAMGQLTEAISEAVSQMGEAIGEATEQVNQAVEEMASGIEDAVSAVSDAVAEMGAAVEEAAGQMAEAAQQAVDAASEIGSAAEEAAAAVEAAMQQMAAAVQAAAGAIEGAAGQIIAALNSIAGAAAAAGAAIGSALAGGFSGELGIASPSKVFVGFGKNIVQGLAVGMGSGPLMERGTDAMAKNAMRGLADAIGMGSPAKKFMPHGAAITQGMMAGMLQEAKGRIKSAMGQMAGAVESGMGKVKSAMASGMERVRSQGQQQAASAGADTARAAATGMTSEERQAERAARRLWRRAYRELMSGVGAARFLGEAWAREFWEGMLDSSGTLEFAQYVTGQIVNAAEDAITAALGKVKGLGTQLEIVAGTIDSLTSDLESLESELASIGQQEQQQRLNDAREELSLQQQITRELEERFKTQFSAAHQAHIRAVQTGSASAQADYEAKLRLAQATDTAAAESRIREEELQASLNAMIDAMAQATREELALRKQAVLEEIALKKAELAQQQALQDSLTAAQQAAQAEYTSAVIDGSQERIRQLEKELRKASGPEQKATIRAQIQLEEQRIATAQQLAAALAAQAGISDTTSAAYAQAAAQVAYFTEQIAALGETDVASLLSGIVSELEKTTTALGTAATAMDGAATAMDGAVASAEAGMGAMTEQAAEFGTLEAVMNRGMFSMANAYDKVMADMAADGEAFQAQFQGMVQQTRGTAEEGAAAIGDALSTGITDRIATGAKPLQQQMLDNLNGAVDETTGEAIKGADAIATEFGGSMRAQMGTELSQVHQQVLGGMTKTADDAERDMAQGGKDVAAAYGQSSTDKLGDEIPKFQRQMNQGMNDAVRGARQIASQGGRDVGNDLAAGVQAGLQSQTNQIANQAAQTVKQAIQAARDAAKANSPSQRMMDVGDDMGLGLVLGLRGRTGDARDASEGLVHIPLSPTSAGGVSGRRAYEERHGTTQNITIERLELPGVTNPEEFVEILNRWAAENGVASG